MENQAVSEIELGEKVKNLVASFDNTGLVLVIGAHYEMLPNKLNNKLELHSVDLEGSKGKFESIFLEEESPLL